MNRYYSEVLNVSFTVQGTEVCCFCVVVDRSVVTTVGFGDRTVRFSAAMNNASRGRATVLTVRSLKGVCRVWGGMV